MVKYYKIQPCGIYTVKWVKMEAKIASWLMFGYHFGQQRMFRGLKNFFFDVLGHSEYSIFGEPILSFDQKGNSVHLAYFEALWLEEYKILPYLVHRNHEKGLHTVKMSALWGTVEWVKMEATWIWQECFLCVLR